MPLLVYITNELIRNIWGDRSSKEFLLIEYLCNGMKFLGLLHISKSKLIFLWFKAKYMILYQTESLCILLHILQTISSDEGKGNSKPQSVSCLWQFGIYILVVLSFCYHIQQHYTTLHDNKGIVENASLEYL